jgi:hypothetical protein
MGLNPAGQIAFTGDTGGDDSYGVIFTPPASDTDLNALIPVSGVNAMTASAINGAGNVAGTYSSNYGNPSQAYFWNASAGSFTFLPLFNGSDPQVAVTALNGANQVVGTYAKTGTFGAPTQGFLWDGTKTHLIPTLGGSSSEANASYATNTAVGCAQNAAGDWIPISYSATTGKNTQIGNPKGYPTGCANSINSNGEVVGQSTSSTACEGWSWKAGTFTALPTFSGACTDPRHVANSGQIVGTSGSNGGIVMSGSSISNLNNALPFNVGLPINDATANNLNGEIATWSGGNQNRASLLVPITALDDRVLSYTGSGWTQESVQGAYKNTLTETTGGVSGRASYTFTGSFVSVIGRCATGDAGQATISVDGGPGTLVDETACARTGLRIPIYTHFWSGASTHTITISVSASQTWPFTIDAVSYDPKA